MLKIFQRKHKAPAQKTPKDEGTQKGISLNISDDVPLHLEEGKGDVFDVICPDGLDTSSDNLGWITDSLSGKRPFRAMYITKAGYPRVMETDWISKLLGIGEVDVTIYAHKIPRRQALQTMKKELTILNSNKEMQIRLGQINELHDINTKLNDTDALLQDTQTGRNDLFHTSVQACAYGETEEMLDRLTEFLEDELGGMGFHLRSAYERQHEGYLSVLPRGQNELLDTYRNLDRRSLCTLFPFASSEMKFKGGVPFALNQSTGNLVFLNLFAEDNNNYNGALLGESGSGKTFAIETLVARNLLMGVRSLIIDPEGEFKRFTKRLGGLYIKLGADSPYVLNPCALTVTEVALDDDDDEEIKAAGDGYEIIVKEDGREYIRFVPVNEKIQELVNLFNLMVLGFEEKPLNNFEETYLLKAIQECFKDAQITTDPKSLYKQEPVERNGKIYHDLVPKEEITISDIYNKLKKLYGQEPKAERLIVAIEPWLRGGVRGFFDGPTYLGEGVSTDLLSSKLITFDLSEFELGSPLRKICYHTCQVWTWHKFVKNPMLAEEPKIVVSDEFWQVIDQDETVTFAETMGRRCRKRHASYIIASQDAKRVLENPKAYGVITNCSTVFILKQNPINYKLMKETFSLSDGELAIVMGRTKKGEMILRTQNESVWVRTDPFLYEKVLFESNSKKKAEMERQMKAMKESMEQQKIKPEVESLKLRIQEEEGDELDIEAILSEEGVDDEVQMVDEELVTLLRGDHLEIPVPGDNYTPSEQRNYIKNDHRKILEEEIEMKISN